VVSALNMTPVTVPVGLPGARDRRWRRPRPDRAISHGNAFGENPI